LFKAVEPELNNFYCDQCLSVVIRLAQILDLRLGMPVNLRKPFDHNL